MRLKILILYISICFASCESFTEIDLPQSQLTGPAVYDDTTTATAALLNIYASLRENGMPSGNAQGLSILMGSYADELTVYNNTSPVSKFYNHTVVSSDTSVANFFTTAYAQIYATNALIEGLDNSSVISLLDKNQIKGEALFIRAYLHLCLANLFGDIPYITTTDYRINRMAEKMEQASVFENITLDMLQSLELVADEYPTAERIRVNKFVVSALLARVYLYQGKWQQAEERAQQVIDNGDYSLTTDLDLVFLKDSPSTILALHSGLAGNNTVLAQTLTFTSGPPPFAAISPQLLGAFEPGDQRKEHWLGNVTSGGDTWYFPYKYKLITNTGNAQEYAILLRIEEQYLIRAEARAHLSVLGGALEDLNKVRVRAGLQPSLATTQQDILDRISHERQVELFLEHGDRWFDLKRMGRASNVFSLLKPNWQNTQLLLPIPESELLLNQNLNPQNPGY